MEPFFPALTVAFASAEGEEPVPGEPIREEHGNLHGRARQTCRLVGECDIGCNYGSKNTLDFNYLSAAERLGAELRTGREVEAFEPRAGGGYSVRYREHPISPDSDGPPQLLDNPDLYVYAHTHTNALAERGCEFRGSWMLPFPSSRTPDTGTVAFAVGSRSCEPRATRTRIGARSLAHGRCPLTRPSHRENGRDFARNRATPVWSQERQNASCVRATPWGAIHGRRSPSNRMRSPVPEAT